MKEFQTKLGKTIFFIITRFILIFLKINNIFKFLFKTKINSDISQKKRIYRFSLIIISILLLFLLKLNHIKINIINIIFEITILFILYLITLPRKKEIIFFYAIKNYIFNIFFYLSISIFSLNSIYILETIQMKFSFYNINFSVIPFVIKNMIKVNYIIYFIIGIIIINLFAIKLSTLFNKKKDLFKFSNIFILTIIFSLISILFYAAYSENVTNVYINSIEDSFKFLTKKSIPINQTIIHSKIPEINLTKNITEGKKILVFVMEQTSLNDFNRELKNPTFFNLVRNNTHFYSNYYTQNQDSRTSIWAIMYQIFQPFESYIDKWNEHYGYIMDKKNLIDIFNENNYKTIGASSVSNIGLIMGAMNWTDYILLKNYQEKSKNYICFNEFEYQKGCEDLAIIDEIKQFVKENNNESYFLFQELIFGHGEEYLKEAKETRTQYYNDYFYELYDYMLENNLYDENTYIIIVSDHGPKGFNERKVEDFNIPFFVINKNFNYEINNNLTSHQKFENIIQNEIYNNSLEVNKSEIYLIGQTSKNIIGYKNENQEFIGNLINDVFYINKFKNINLTQIEKKIIDLKILQNSFINKSLEKYFYCKLCTLNKNKFE